MRQASGSDAQYRARDGRRFGFLGRLVPRSAIVARTMRVLHREHAGRPVRVVWTLEELGQPYELTVMSREESRGEEHRARHPLGRVPVLQDDEGVVFASAAIGL